MTRGKWLFLAAVVSVICIAGFWAGPSMSRTVDAWHAANRQAKFEIDAYNIGDARSFFASGYSHSWVTGDPVLVSEAPHPVVVRVEKVEMVHDDQKERPQAPLYRIVTVSHAAHPQARAELYFPVTPAGTSYARFDSHNPYQSRAECKIPLAGDLLWLSWSESDQQYRLLRGPQADIRPPMTEEPSDTELSNDVTETDSVDEEQFSEEDD